MQNALYPKRFGDNCPYCGSDHVENVNDIRPTAEGCSVECLCNNCGRSHHLNYSVASVMLENDQGIADTDFHYPVAELQDQGVDDPSTTPTIPVGVVATSQGIMFMAAGYGDGASAPGYGAPVIIENYKGTLRIIVWSDINEDDVSDIIDLGSARHSECAAEPEYPFRASRHTSDGVQIEEHQFDTLAEANAFAVNHLTDIPGHYALVRDIAQDSVVWDSREAQH
jgi:transcription elongation factor Elf1